MNAELLGRLIGMTRGYLVVTDFDRAAIEAASNEHVAMRTPITPDTLTAAGWVVVYKGISGDIYQCPTSKRIEIGIFDDESTFYLGRRGGVIPVPTNMCDLGELVRLLGGAQ